MSYRLMKGLNTHDKQRHVECQKGRIVHVELALRVNSSLMYHIASHIMRGFFTFGSLLTFRVF